MILRRAAISNHGPRRDETSRAADNNAKNYLSVFEARARTDVTDRRRSAGKPVHPVKVTRREGKKKG